MKNNKKIVAIIIILLALALILLSMYLIDAHKMKNNEPVIFSTWGKSYAPAMEEKEPETNIENEISDEPKEPEYVDNNTVKLGLYVENGNNLELVTDDYTCDWSPENVMGLFYAIPSQEETISNYNFDSMWKEKISEYPNSEKCRIGYNIQFEMNDGTKVNKNILNPDDAFYMFPKVMFYLYDDVNLVPGKPYYHITQDVMYDYTICSSAKLVGDVDSPNISTDIKLTAFCWDSEDDFDPETGMYRGNSSYTITIKHW